MILPGIVAGGTVGGGADPNTLSLLHFDGADGSTTFTDEVGITWTPVSSAQLDTAQSKFGPSSAILAPGDWLDATDAVFAVGPSADFTAEVFVRLAALTGNHFVLGFGAGWGVYALTFGGNQWALFDGVASNVIIGGSSAINTWYHVALVRDSGTFRLFVDGISIGTVANSTDFSTGNMRLGAQTSGAGGLNGWLDEWRFSDVARYTSNFTPPAAPFS